MRSNLKIWSVEELEWDATWLESQGHNYYHTLDRPEDTGVERLRKHSTMFPERLKGPSSVRPTLELFQRQRWERFWETGRSAYGFPSAHKYLLALNWTERTASVTLRNPQQEQRANLYSVDWGRIDDDWWTTDRRVNTHSYSYYHVMIRTSLADTAPWIVYSLQLCSSMYKH